jgi:hypothetical protein
MKLVIVHEEKGDIYAEFETKDFRKVLIEEFKITQDVGRAFDRTCQRLKDVLLRQ